jgi:hypothetical protein
MHRVDKVNSFLMLMQSVYTFLCGILMTVLGALNMVEKFKNGALKGTHRRKMKQEEDGEYCVKRSSVIITPHQILLGLSC